MEDTSYIAQLANGWQLAAWSFAGETVLWLTNDHIDTGFYETTIAGTLPLDLERLDYAPVVFHDGGDAPPLVVFHPYDPERPRYVWEPHSGRIYRTGSTSHI